MAPLADITQDLRDYIYVTRSQINEWVETEKAEIDSAAEQHRQALALHQTTIDQKATQLLALQSQGGSSMSDKSDANHSEKKAVLVENQKQVRQEIDVLRAKLASKLDDVERLQIEVHEHKQQAHQAQTMKQRVTMSQQTTIDDLTRGILNNKYLGLDFMRAEDDALRFVFTQIDPNEPSREFSFTIKTNNMDDYESMACEPPVAAQPDLLRELNEQDDLSAFVRAMRQEFVDMV